MKQRKTGDKGMEKYKEPQYWNGFWNKIIRYNFYMQTGANVFNIYKYVFGSIIAIYWMTHCDNKLILISSFIIMMPVLIIIGYYSIHHINKVNNWLDVKFGSHYTIRQIELLEEIRDAINNKIN